MKPIKLTLSGFITYRDTQTIDFTKFEQGSLFIVSGATGSGKTTIFDAICFALYGKISSQNRGEGEELRSQYLSPEDDKTFVEFEFQENGERIRIRREPRQVMKRPRGKIDTVSEEVELYLGNEVMTSKREVDEKIVELTGLTWDQFTKIVMLPQGEFRKFLSASSKEKEEILRKIFDTVPYQRFLEQVKQKYSMIQKKFEKMKDEVNALVSILDLEESACIQEFLNDNSLEPAFYLKALENMVQEQEKNRKETEEIEESLKKFEQQYQNCKNQISMANRHNAQLSQFQQKQEELGKLIPLEQEMKKRKEACIQAEKALSFYKEEVRLESVSDRIQKRNEELEQLIQQEKEWEEKSVAAKKEAEKIPYLSEEEEKKVKELEEWNQKEEQYGRLQEILHQEKEFEVQKRKLEQEKIKIQTSLKECEEVLRSLEKIGEKFEKSQEELLQTEKELSKTEWELDKYRLIYRELKKTEKFEQDLSLLQKSLGTNQQNSVLLYQKVQDAKKEFEQSLLTVYARDLEEGTACPLCGSIHHPHPIHEVTSVTKEEIISLEEQLKEIQETAVRQQTEKKHLEDAILSSREQILQLQETSAFQVREFSGTSEELVFYEECGKSCADRKKNLEQTQVRLQAECEEYKRKRELEKNEREQVERCQEKMQNIMIQTEKLSVSSEHSTRLKTELEEKLKGIDEQQLKSQRQTLMKEKKQIHETIEKIRTEFQKSVDAYSKISTKVSEWKQYQKEETSRYHVEKQDWERKITQEFSDMETYRNNCMEESVLEQEKKQVEEFLEEYRVLSVEVKTLEQTLESKTAIDIQPLEKEIYSLEEVRKELQNTKEKLQQQYKSVHTLENKIREVLSHEEEYALKRMNLAKLYQLCSGENPMKATLETYVLMYFFEEVLMYANQRLYKMTDGQYTLYRKEDNFKGGGKNRGLELEILDTNVGKKRSTAMLSGGESFLASLALALGLSDAIMNTAGQIEIDTLFIDEGFGTLDQDRLQSAVDCLLELAGRNRMIGIISHVEELKSTIPNKIIVTYEKERGSTLSLMY